MVVIFTAFVRLLAGWIRFIGHKQYYTPHTVFGIDKVAHDQHIVWLFIDQAAHGQHIVWLFIDKAAHDVTVPHMSLWSSFRMDRSGLLKALFSWDMGPRLQCHLSLWQRGIMWPCGRLVYLHSRLAGPPLWSTVPGKTSAKSQSSLHRGYFFHLLQRCFWFRCHILFFKSMLTHCVLG